MVLRLKTWESRSLPGLQNSDGLSQLLLFLMLLDTKSRPALSGGFFAFARIDLENLQNLPRRQYMRAPDRGPIAIGICQTPTSNNSSKYNIIIVP